MDLWRPGTTARACHEEVDSKHLQRLHNGDDPADEFQEHLDDGCDEDYLDNLLLLCEMGGRPDEDAEPEYSLNPAGQPADTLVITSGTSI